MNASAVKNWQQDRNARFRIAVRGDEVHCLAYECDEGGDAKFNGVEIEVKSRDWDEAIRLTMVAYDVAIRTTQPLRDARYAAVAAISDFHRCPNTGQVIHSTIGDDKALCLCGKTNPKFPMELEGVHVKSFLETATAEQFAMQENARMLPRRPAPITGVGRGVLKR